MKLFHRIERAALQGLLSLPPHVLRRLVGAPIVSPDGDALDLQAQGLLRAMKLAREPDLHMLSLNKARANMDRSVPLVDYAPIDMRTTDRTIPGPRGPISIRVYHPGLASTRKPVIVYFHGGGWVVGSVASHDGLCRTLASKTEALVVSVDYRRAPEHKFPAAVDDAVAAVRWVIAESDSFGGEARSVAVAGDSAGGNLATVITQEMRRDAVRPMFQLLMYPPTDMTCSMRSHTLFREGYLLTEASITWYLGHYISIPSEKMDPRGSPLFANDVRGLPPAYIVTAGFDPLRDEGRAYAEKLRAAGVAVEYRCLTGAVHGFFTFGGIIEHARQAVDDAARALRNAFAERADSRVRAPVSAPN